MSGVVRRFLLVLAAVAVVLALPGRTSVARADGVAPSAYTRPETEEQLLAALEEIGTDGGGAIDFAALGIDFGGEPQFNDAEGVTSHEAGEAEEIPEVDSPLDE